MNPRILILHASIGGGHASAANALKLAFEQAGVQDVTVSGGVVVHSGAPNVHGEGRAPFLRASLSNVGLEVTSPSNSGFRPKK